MATSLTSAAARGATATALRTTRTLSTAAALRAGAGSSSTSSYQSPFKGTSDSSKIPDFSKYMSKGSGSKNQLYGYFMVGTLGAISAAGAKSTIQGESLGWRGGENGSWGAVGRGGRQWSAIGGGRGAGGGGFVVVAVEGIPSEDVG